MREQALERLRRGDAARMERERGAVSLDRRVRPPAPLEGARAAHRQLRAEHGILSERAGRAFEPPREIRVTRARPIGAHQLLQREQVAPIELMGLFIGASGLGPSGETVLEHGPLGHPERRALCRFGQQTRFGVEERQRLLEIAEREQEPAETSDGRQEGGGRGDRLAEEIDRAAVIAEFFLGDNGGVAQGARAPARLARPRGTVERFFEACVRGVGARRLRRSVGRTLAGWRRRLRGERA